MSGFTNSKVKFQVTIWESVSPELYQRLAGLNERQRAEEARYLMRVGLEMLAGARPDAQLQTPPPLGALSSTPLVAHGGGEANTDWGIGGALMHL